MKHTIKLLFLNILLFSAPALQAMGSVRTFGARAFRTASASAAKFKMNAQALKAHQPFAKPFGFKNGGKQGSYKKYAHTASVMPLVKMGVLYGAYDKIKEWFGYGPSKNTIDTVDKQNIIELAQHDYDAPIPEEIKKILDEHAEEFLLEMRQRKVRVFDWLPGWMAKRDPSHSRLEGAKRFAAAIKELKCASIIVPRKYRYTDPFGNNYTIAELVESSREKITQEELRQLAQIVQKLRWIDAHDLNIIKISENKIACIDTEMRTIFEDSSQFDPLAWNLYKPLLTLRLTDDAKKYLDRLLIQEHIIKYGAQEK